MAAILPEQPHNYDSLFTTPRDGESSVYRARLAQLSDLLIQTDWRELKEKHSPVLDILERELRHILVEIEQWQREQKADRTLSIDIITSAINNALIALYTASSIGNASDMRRITEFYNQIALCRRYLAVAVNEFPLTDVPPAGLKSA